MNFLTIELKSSPELARVVKAADPTYKKRKAYLLVANQVTLRNTYWDGGSRSTYTAVDLLSGVSKGAPQYNPPQFGGPKVDPTVDIPINVAVVETGVFCGKTATALIRIRPENAATLISSN